MKKASSDAILKNVFKAVLTGMTALCVVCGPLCRAQCPLPDDVALIPPSSGIPRDIALFAGAWGGGAWGGELPTFLVVEQVNAGGAAHAVYSWGNGERAGIKAGWTRLTGLISNGRLHLSAPGGAVIDYNIEKSGKLYGRYTLRGHPSSVELVREVALNKEAIIAAAAQPISPIWEEIRIPERSKTGETSGRALSLQATLYRTRLPGRHPVVIFNHGSTGPGIVPVALVARAWDPALIFRSLGCSIIVPMRKGRGKSDGTVVEESTVSQEMQLESAVEDLDAVVEYVKAEPYADPARIVVAGQSRGGFLSVIYAGRYPEKVAGVVNFSGGWWGEHTANAGFNVAQFRQAGHAAKIPMLWLYADHDRFYSLGYIERAFDAFRSRGGRGRLLEVPDVEGEGHFLFSWPEKWKDAVTVYLDGIGVDGPSTVYER